MTIINVYFSIRLMQPHLLLLLFNSTVPARPGRLNFACWTCEQSQNYFWVRPSRRRDSFLLYWVKWVKQPWLTSSFFFFSSASTVPPTFPLLSTTFPPLFHYYIVHSAINTIKFNLQTDDRDTIVDWESRKEFFSRIHTITTKVELKNQSVSQTTTRAPLHL